ncbi:hypothetical protein KS553_004383 [Escherichia coli]|uniref:hypothetical protein n=1 Tax=Escherichia TaxID=561 RepID=UPI000578E884|nr:MULTISPECIES: hypothetical protein [Escherichia]EGO6622929.1 hypothetical protein [Escherichia coli]EGO8034350.1 hypothetical protein [Escherichia coli]EGO8686931.1 hypothetical protein [Escherichia coli]EGO8724740.1 hypothetical protein [Escherichia coli]EGP6253315.1 hypothetical protein [Escherichia coli]
MTLINENIWRERFKGWIVTECAIRNSNILYFCVRKELSAKRLSSMWDSEIPTRIVAIYLHKPENPYGHAGVKGFNNPRIGIALSPKEQAILSSCDENGDVFVVGSGDNWPMEEICKDGRWPSTQKLKCLFNQTWSVGEGRRIYKRTAIGQWVPVMDGFPQDIKEGEWGFNDIDAFSEDDMYTIGGSGDIWRYDGHQWNMCGFPSNEQLSTVVCAPDGNVYIGGEGGNIWVGRNDTWRRVYEGHATILWNEMRWFEGELWLASDYMLKVWDGKTLERPMDGDKPVVLSGHIDARDGILVVAGGYTIDLYDGKEWKSIMKPF